MKSIDIVSHNASQSSDEEPDNNIINNEKEGSVHFGGKKVIDENNGVIHHAYEPEEVPKASILKSNKRFSIRKVRNIDGKPILHTDE